MNEFELFFFDLDGTLTESRSNLDKEMGKILERLLKKKKVVVISGADFNQFKKQFIDFLPKSSNFKNLYVAPLTGGSFYNFEEDSWEKIYEDSLSKEERERIIEVLKKVADEDESLQSEEIFGKQIQDRIGQVTFSALGDKAPLEVKKDWDPDTKKRISLKEIMDKYLSDFEVSVGGSTSIDIRKEGIDKAYGINKISSFLSIPKEKIIFFGDAIFEGGNDYSVISTGVRVQKVSGPKDTKNILEDYMQEEEKIGVIN